MTPEALRMWRELEVRSLGGVPREVQAGEVATSLAFDSERMLAVVSELLRFGAVVGLSDEEIGALAMGQPVEGNLIVLAFDVEDWEYLRVESRETLRSRFAARRELIRRRIRAVNSLNDSPLDRDAARILQALPASQAMLDEAKSYPITEDDWSTYGNMPADFFVRHWNKLRPEDDHGRIKTLAILAKVAEGCTSWDMVALSRDVLAQNTYRHEVAALSQVIAELSITEMLSSGRARPPIPKAVQHEVWRRDQGRCVQCGSQENLEFDHMIPYAEGGSSTARNIQLLCEICNRRKSDTI